MASNGTFGRKKSPGGGPPPPVQPCPGGSEERLKFKNDMNSGGCGRLWLVFSNDLVFTGKPVLSRER